MDWPHSGVCGYLAGDWGLTEHVWLSAGVMRSPGSYVPHHPACSPGFVPVVARQVSKTANRRMKDHLKTIL